MRGEGDNPQLAGASEMQRRASNPAVSVWTSANAGSGKTRVLTDRVARLLLAGARPDRVLCLTYTRAAAAEMAARLRTALGGWALAEPAALEEAMRRLAGEGAALDAATLGRARALFAQALDAPGGLRIQTIHAFCEATLRRFPLEAGVAPDFTVLDDADRREAAARARDRVALEDPDAFDAAGRHVTDETLESLCDEIFAKRALFEDGPDPERLAAAFGVRLSDLDSDPLTGLWDGLDRAALARAAEILCAGSRNDGWVGGPLAEALAAGSPEEAAAALCRALRKGDGAPRDFDKIPVKATDASHPWIRPLLIDLCATLDPVLRLDEAVAAARRAVDLARFAAAFLAAFEDEKAGRAALDFDDLIRRARDLLADPEGGAWARFKLDGGVDHILVDEAQDTSPDQWAVIEALAAEFFAGAGAARPGAGPPRSLFVVGDEKQSIYSFQGADVRVYAARRAAMTPPVERGGWGLREQEMITSFRSASAILKAVDRTFAAAAEGVTYGGAPPSHATAKTDLVGRVDLWPLLRKDPEAQEPPWFEPLDATPAADPKLKLADALAREIRRWLDEGERLPGEGRRIRAGDILVLVRKRDALAAELVRRLKNRGVAVAGADRLELTESLAARDLIALARFALTPDDDLSLAAFLRSPLGGLSGAALEALLLTDEGTARPETDPPGALWRALRAAPEHAALTARLREARSLADFLRPYEFFERALGGDCAPDGRRRMVARLGPEAEDAIDELLGQAIAYETGRTPTLEGFLDWLERGELVVKREMDRGGGAVRVMTVHGAKGLEAPVVILPDCGPRKGGRGRSIAEIAAPGSNDEARLPAWRPPGSQAAPLEEAKERAKIAERDEERRLLYVAMTRAERWLIVCGAGESKPEGAECWHGLVSAGLSGLPGALTVGAPRPVAEGVSPTILRLQDAGAASDQEVEAAEAAEATVPAWASRRPAPVPEAPSRWRASGLGGNHGGGAALRPDPAPLDAPAPGAEEPARDPARALDRGTAVHALLERLPDAPPPARERLAARLLDRLAPWAGEAERAAMLAEAEAAQAATGAEALFRPGAVAEAAVSVEIAGLGRVSGRIDRLATTKAEVVAVDFKTDAAPPPEGAAPEPYLRQLAVYREGLRRLYPGRMVRMTLLWTVGPRLETLSDAALDAALERAVAEGAS